MQLRTLETKLATMDDGLLRHGSHAPGRKFCALEFESQVRGREWSDRPITLPDLRPLNDAFGRNDKLRTHWMLRVMAALWDWSEWSEQKRQRWAERVAVETVRQIIAELPGLSDEIRKQCRAARTLLAAARAAAEAAA